MFVWQALDNDIISVFVKLQTPATVPVHVTPCLGSFENRGSYIKFLGRELLSGPAVQQTQVNILAFLAFFGPNLQIYIRKTQKLILSNSTPQTKGQAPFIASTSTLWPLKDRTAYHVID